MAGNYEEALKQLKLAVEYDEENDNALFYLGRTYHYMHEDDEAKKYYQQVMTKFPDSRRASQAEGHLNELS